MKFLTSCSLLAAGILCAAPPALYAATSAEIAEWLAQIQSDKGSVRVEAILKAGPMGAAAVVPLADTASGSNRDASLAAITALKHLAAYAGRPGAAGEKSAVAQALTQTLDPKYSKVTRCLGLELLSWTGGDEIVPQVAALLGDADADVRDEAKRSLQAIPGKAALKALIGALGKADGPFKLALIAALGQRAEPEAADALIAATSSSDMNVALSALDAVARLGMAKDDRVNLPDWDSLNDSQRTRLANAVLRWADQRAAKGAVEDALQAYGAIAERASSEHLACAALIGAAKASPDAAFPYVVRALRHEENSVRTTAVHLLEAQKGDDNQAKALIEAFASAKPEARECILRVLKAWNDKRLGS